MESWAGLIGAVLGAGGLGTAVGVVGKYLYDRQKLTGEQSLAEAAQTDEQWEGIVKDLRERMKVVEGEVKECRREHGNCQYQLGEMNGRLAEMRQHVNHMHTTAVRQAVEAAKSGAEAGVKAGAEIASKPDSGILGKVDKDHPLPVEVMQPKE